MHPLIAVRTALADARTAGVPFDVAWTAARRLAPADWRSALNDTADAWRAAYCRESAPARLRAVSLLAEDTEPVPLTTTTERATACGHCRGPIPSTRKRGSRYCSTVCQRQANGRQLAAA